MRERYTHLLIGAGSIVAAILLVGLHVQTKEIWWFVMLFTILYHGSVLCRLFLTTRRLSSIAIGTFACLAIQSLAQTGWYYLGWNLGATSDAVSLIVMVLVVQLVGFFVLEPPLTPPCPKGENRNTIVAIVLLSIATMATALVLHASITHATSNSIRTPWPLLPSWTLLAIGGVWLTLILSAFVIRRVSFTAIHAMLALFITTSITPLLYKIGFGFDGFLHVASEQILLRTGTLSPKPLYYIGQYVFTTWAARLTEISVADVDRWLVPVSASIFIPLCCYAVFRSNEPGPSVPAATLILALLPLSGFVATTPQSFAYVLGLCGLILCLGTQTKTVHPIAPLLFGAWAAAVHPLAGIPILFVLLAVILKRQRILSWICVILAGIAVPMLFIMIGTASGTAIEWKPDTLSNAATWLAGLNAFVPWIGNHFVLWPAWATLVDRIIPVSLLLLAITGSLLRRKQGLAQYLVSAIVLFVAAVALKATGDFIFLIDYERGNYADRLNTIGILCLIPPAAIGLGIFVDRVRATSWNLKGALALSLVAIPTALAYNALPRHDAMIVGHGWSVSANDIDAVKWIDADAGNRPYTVLANQSVSAAAIRSLGFKRYTEDNVFFYPIPTGGPLYQIFLRMTYQEPSRDTAKDAAALGKSDLVYVVLNSYWWNAPAVAEATRVIANDRWSINNDAVRVYKFDFKKDSNAPTATSTR